MSSSALNERDVNIMRDNLTYYPSHLEKGNVKLTVSKKTMRYIPFVTSEEEIMYDSAFAKITIAGMGIGNNIEDINEQVRLRKEFWRRNRLNAYRALNHRRANMSTLMGKKFRGKYRYEHQTKTKTELATKQHSAGYSMSCTHIQASNIELFLQV